MTYSFGVSSWAASFRFLFFFFFLCLVLFLIFDLQCKSDRRNILSMIIFHVSLSSILFSDVWTFVQPMSERRLSAAAVSLNDQIFIFGGCDGQNVLSSCEVYDTKRDRWQQIPPMKVSRMKHSAAVHAGRVYIIGGVSEREGPGLKSVECYIPEENRWTRVPDMPSGRFDHQCHVCDVRYKFVAHVMDNHET